MSPAKRDANRPSRRWSKPEQPPTSRCGGGYWVVRWIGAAKRRAAKLAETPAIAAPSADIINLNWADTFGRPAQNRSLGFLQPAGTIVRLIPLLR